MADGERVGDGGKVLFDARRPRWLGGHIVRRGISGAPVVEAAMMHGGRFRGASATDQEIADFEAQQRLDRAVPAEEVATIGRAAITEPAPLGELPPPAREEEEGLVLVDA